MFFRESVEFFERETEKRIIYARLEWSARALAFVAFRPTSPRSAAAAARERPVGGWRRERPFEGRKASEEMGPEVWKAIGLSVRVF